MQAKWLDQAFEYDGSQLRSLYSYMNHGLLGDSVVAWAGACEVTPDHMVDGEDLRAKAAIRGNEMVHFIVEKFDCSLLAAVALQRLLATIVKDVLIELAEDKKMAIDLRRDGDDLFFGERKLSISIATVSPVSALIHFAVNVVNEGTPVPTLALEDFRVKSKAFADLVMKRFTAEMASAKEATQKVFWVK